MAYDALGNITSKTSVGSYSYPAAGQARPHAVSSITGTVNGVVNPTYTYDANGNMTAGAGRTVTYTAFNMAASIVQGTTTVAFTYDSEHARVQMTAPSGTTTYVNDTGSGARSEKFVSGTTTTWRDYLMADGKLVAEKFSGGTTAMRYFVSDHLGSVAVVMDESGTVLERDAYDAWGKRRNLDGSDDTSCSLTSQTTRGFTGHEQLDAVCLINANARIYDATLGKFMSPDSIIPDPFDGQSFNRYAYVNNNPLSATDPTGHMVVINGPGYTLIYPHWYVVKDNGPGGNGGSGGYMIVTDKGVVVARGGGTNNGVSGGTGSSSIVSANSSSVKYFYRTWSGTLENPYLKDNGLSHYDVPVSELFSLGGSNNAGLQNANWSSSDGMSDGTVRGPDGSVLTRTQIGNIVFNELRSLSGPGLDNAELYVAHAIINGQLDFGSKRPSTASTVANPGATEGDFYYNAQMSASLAIEQAGMRIDPTGGAAWFNLRNTNSTSDFQGHSISTQSGPFDNSYTRGGLNSTGVYVNTYGGGGGT